MRALIIILVVFISCNTSTSKQGQAALADTLSNKQQDQQNDKPYNSKIIWSTDNVRIWGDTSNGKIKIDYTSYKFEPYISFEDFKVDDLFTGKKALINYQSNVTARRYKTRITETYQEQGLNFGGHYCFVWWGCGSPCKASAIVDLENGKVYDGPTSALGYNFKKNSTMIIINPGDSTGFYDDCAYCHPEIWIWNEKQKAFKQRLPNKD